MTLKLNGHALKFVSNLGFFLDEILVLNFYYDHLVSKVRRSNDILLDSNKTSLYLIPKSILKCFCYAIFHSHL